MDHVAKQRRHGHSQGDQLDDPQHSDDRAGDDLHDAIGNSGVQRLATAGAQAKMEVGGADDAYEHEAEQVADEVMGGSVAQPARTSEGAAPDVQREGGGEAFSAGEQLGDELASGGGGQRLPDDMRATMEAKTGASLGDVRVHDDAGAHDRTASVGAHAFTHGTDIHFAQGAYDPGSKAGQHLLAHELTHVVQQRGGQTGDVQRKAISAAPASVQRMWNPFKKKEKAQAKELPSYDEMQENPTLKDHWVKWNAEDNWGDKLVEWDAKREPFSELMVVVSECAETALHAMARDDSDLEQVAAFGQLEWAIGKKRFSRGMLDELKPLAAANPDGKAFFGAWAAYIQAFDRASSEAKQLKGYLTSHRDELNVCGGEVQRAMDDIDSGVLSPMMLRLKEGNHGGDNAGLYQNTYLEQDHVKDFYGKHA